jgi:hypothetical protein
VSDAPQVWASSTCAKPLSLRVGGSAWRVLPAKGRASVLKSDARANPQAIPMKTRILLADDHQLFREALCHLLDSQSDLEVAGQVGNGLEVVEQARRTGAQIVCMDISMPGMHGAEVTQPIDGAAPGQGGGARPTPIGSMCWTCCRPERWRMSPRPRRVRGVVASHPRGSAGRSYLCPDVAAVVTGAAVVQSGGAPGSVRLGVRERQVLKLVAEGCTSNQMQKCSTLHPPPWMCTAATSCASSTCTASQS